MMTKKKTKKVKKSKVKSPASSRFLENVPDHQIFYCQDGNTLKNLEELGIALKDMRAGIFLYHVHPGKNDFANWIYDVIGDVDLAEDIRDLTDQKDFIRKIDSRIASIKKASKGE